MTIRTKILGLSTAILALLCIALFISLRFQKGVQEEMAGITEYHLRLTALMAEIDAETFEYELILARLLHFDDPSNEATQAIVAREREVIRAIKDDFTAANELLVRAAADKRNDEADRIGFARLHGSFTILQREVAPFEELGLSVIEAYRRGDHAEARRLHHGFERFERIFGPDLASIRRDMEQLAQESTVETLGQQNDALRFSLALFVVAAALGLGLASIMASRMVASLRRLLAGAQAIESGRAHAPLPVTGSDEIGQLTRAFNHMVSEIATKERIKDTFGKYVDPKIVANLIGSDGAAQDTAERRVLTVMFADIQGFSAISEQLTAAVVANLLNRYFTVATDAVRARNGVVDKYIGDSLMAFWAAPFSPGDNHARDACLAALDIQEALKSLRADLPQILGLRRQVPDFVVRIGIATGEVVLGTIGAPTAKSFTVIGDAVNLASRIESINRLYGTSILITEDTYRLANDTVEVRELDTVTAAGKTEPVRIFELIGAIGATVPGAAALRDKYADGLALYRARDWDKAEAAFASCLSLDAADGPSKLFAERSRYLRANPPPADWDGAWRFAEK
ncbi:MAG: adenylate/guanylate cyclase domain-containing protein [Alphaproteobacteria bacterium]